MSLREIVVYPHPTLLERAAEVDGVDEDLRRLVEDMVATMHAEAGVGLAANQVDDKRRVFVLDLSAGEDPDAIKVMINPEILEREGEEVGEEGCLSFPGIFEFVARPRRIFFRYRNIEFDLVEEEAEGFYARAVCHETDHLDGIVFTERMSPLKRRLVIRRIEKLKKLGEWPEVATI